MHEDQLCLCETPEMFHRVDSGSRRWSEWRGCGEGCEKRGFSLIMQHVPLATGGQESNALNDNDPFAIQQGVTVLCSCTQF